MPSHQLATAKLYAWQNHASPAPPNPSPPNNALGSYCEPLLGGGITKDGATTGRPLPFDLFRLPSPVSELDDKSQTVSLLIGARYEVEGHVLWVEWSGSLIGLKLRNPNLCCSILR